MLKFFIKFLFSSNIFWDLCTISVGIISFEQSFLRKHLFEFQLKRLYGFWCSKVFYKGESVCDMEMESFRFWNVSTARRQLGEQVKASLPF